MVLGLVIIPGFAMRIWCWSVVSIDFIKVKLGFDRLCVLLLDHDFIWSCSEGFAAVRRPNM
jgi:hypothetical protein